MTCRTGLSAERGLVARDDWLASHERHVAVTTKSCRGSMSVDHLA